MLQNATLSCWPWAILLVGSVVVARLLIGASGAKLNWQRLKLINRCQEGSVQSLAFVLTLPFFVMIMMLIVQASQVMVANVAVHYSAYAAARSAA
ncbi:pilus assembly protein, partial [bacterium]|nr:pilus assembly protein [bacterium]